MITFDPLSYPAPSRRFAKFAKNGMVATSQPLAAMAGIEMLRRGGNAVDAAIATAICLTVVEPTSNGIGGDAFALVWSEGSLHGLNASGRSPAAMTIERLMAKGKISIPELGWETVTTPGTPSAWVALSERSGSLPFEELFEPAIAAARGGYAIGPMLGKVWAKAAKNFSAALDGPEFAHWFETFTANGAAPAIGSIWCLPDHAETLDQIAASRGEAFYTGTLAERIDRFARNYDAALAGEDLAAHQVEWVEPISANYRGYDVWEIPPSGQGIIALQALKIYQHLGGAQASAYDRQHYLIEALKAAFADGRRYVGDPACVSVPAEVLLSDAYARRRSEGIGPEAGLPEPIELPSGGTVYLATADNQGNMVSLIQSNYKGFGSGLVVPGTGIALHNRGKDFSLDPEHPNALAPRKRPFHTIIPGFLTRDGQALGPFGAMGGYMQPQGHIQVLTNIIDLGMNPQAALDAPRWRWMDGNRIAVEPHFPNDLAQSLERRGHAIVPQSDETGFGRGQVILRDLKNGVLVGGSDPRTDGEAAVI